MSQQIKIVSEGSNETTHVYINGQELTNIRSIFIDFDVESEPDVTIRLTNPLLDISGTLKSPTQIGK